MTTQTKPDLTEILEDLGCRMTGPRRRMLELLESRHDAFAAEELLVDLPGVGRATVRKRSICRFWLTSAFSPPSV